MAEPEYRAWANAGIAALQRWYRPGTGLWAGTGWWNSAGALTAVIRYTALTGDDYMNAVTTELFFTLAALLHQRSP